MQKLVFDVPEMPVSKDDFFKDGKFQHMGLIPIQSDRLKEILEGNKKLDKRTKQILYITILEIITAMNDMHFYKWLPDLFKTVFIPVFSIKLMSNEILIKLIKEIK